MRGGHSDDVFIWVFLIVLLVLIVSSRKILSIVRHCIQKRRWRMMAGYHGHDVDQL